MRYANSLLAVVLIIAIGCSVQSTDSAIIPCPSDGNLSQSSSTDPSLENGRWGCWGIYDLEIACDGSFANVIPNRTATVRWGYHLNAVKLLEVQPCATCLRTGNLHVLPNGDVSIDVTLEHPWADNEDNRYCTGFDVRGIVMFQASQLFPDNDLLVRAGYNPWHPDKPGDFQQRYSSYLKGDPELMNPDGYTTIFAPDQKYDNYEMGEGLPIFEYYEGRYATGDNLATINAYRNFYTNEERHMFEVGKSATRTYIIRPPDVGPVIEASYAVYAHWAPPSEVPVGDPLTDFPQEANSPMPYEFRVYQTEIIDPDADYQYIMDCIHWYIKSWNFDHSNWWVNSENLMNLGSVGGYLTPIPGGQADEYWLGRPPENHGDFPLEPYFVLNEIEPETFPGVWPVICNIVVFHPDDPWPGGYGGPLGEEFFIAKIEFKENDGEW